jgi:hypothetical protein
MLPFCFEWTWNVDHIIFFGLLYSALTIVGTCVVIAVVKTVTQVFGFTRERHF